MSMLIPHSTLLTYSEISTEHGDFRLLCGSYWWCTGPSFITDVDWPSHRLSGEITANRLAWATVGLETIHGLDMQVRIYLSNVHNLKGDMRVCVLTRRSYTPWCRINRRWKNKKQADVHITRTGAASWWTFHQSLQALVVFLQAAFLVCVIWECILHLWWYMQGHDYTGDVDGILHGQVGTLQVHIIHADLSHVEIAT